ncbi:MAG: hypothetical protein IJQ21_10680 [Lachnospiraceae bacterium]|nr:hypothetical protein [Lachnospiraceae bacterium]
MRLIVLLKPILNPDAIGFNPVRRILTVSDREKFICEDDKSAIELALRWKEEMNAEVSALTFGDETADVLLREALSMGADSGIHILMKEYEDVLSVSQKLADHLRTTEFDYLLTGFRCKNSAMECVGSLLAHRLDMEKINGVTQIIRKGNRINVIQTTDHIRRTVGLPDRCMLGISTTEAVRYMHASRIFGVYASEKIMQIHPDRNENNESDIVGYDTRDRKKEMKVVEDSENNMLNESLRFLSDIGVLAKGKGGVTG